MVTQIAEAIILQTPWGELMHYQRDSSRMRGPSQDISKNPKGKTLNALIVRILDGSLYIQIDVQLPLLGASHPLTHCNRSNNESWLRMQVDT